MAVHKLKRNDTAPAFSSVLSDAAGDPVSLSGASVLFKMRSEADGTLKINGVATITDAAGGAVTYQQSATDVDEAGIFLAEWQVTYADARIQTFPTVGQNRVVIYGDLDT
jgi:hypothetical protein